MNNDVTILTIHMLVILPMQHHMLKFQNDVINVAVFQANLKKEVKSGIVTSGVALLILQAYEF